MDCPLCGADTDIGPCDPPLDCDPLAQLLIHLQHKHATRAFAHPTCCGQRFTKYTQWANHIRDAGHSIEELLVRDALAR